MDNESYRYRENDGCLIEVREDGEIGAIIPFPTESMPQSDLNRAVKVYSEEDGYRVELPSERKRGDETFDWVVKGVPVIGVLESGVSGDMELCGPGPGAARTIQLVDGVWEGERRLRCSAISVVDRP